MSAENWEVKRKTSASMVVPIYRLRIGQGTRQEDACSYRRRGPCKQR